MKVSEDNRGTHQSEDRRRSVSLYIHCNLNRPRIPNEKRSSYKKFTEKKAQDQTVSVYNSETF